MKYFVFPAILALATLARAEVPSSQPIRVESLKTWPTVAPEKNAVPAILKIAPQVVKKRRTAPDAPDPSTFQSKGLADLAALRSLVGHMKIELDALDAILTQDAQFDWGDAPVSPVVLEASQGTQLPEVGLIVCGGLLTWDAQMAASDEDWGRCFKRLRQASLLARETRANALLENGNIASAIQRAERKAVAYIAGAKQFDSSLRHERAEVERLIHAYFASDAARAAVLAELRVQRLIADDAFEAMNEGRLKGGGGRGEYLEGSIAGRMLSQPFAGPKQMQWLSELAAGFESVLSDPAVPFAVREFSMRLNEAVVVPLKKDPARMTALGAIAGPSLGQISRSAIEEHAFRRTIAVALAIRLYMFDHDGKPPADLKVLTGRYLPGEPLDPAASKEAVIIQYRPDTRVVYSCGPSGKDDGGSGDDFVVTLSPSVTTN